MLLKVKLDYIKNTDPNARAKPGTFAWYHPYEYDNDNPDKASLVSTTWSTRASIAARHLDKPVKELVPVIPVFMHKEVTTKHANSTNYVGRKISYNCKIITITYENWAEVTRNGFINNIIHGGTGLSALSVPDEKRLQKIGETDMLYEIAVKKVGSSYSTYSPRTLAPDANLSYCEPVEPEN